MNKYTLFKNNNQLKFNVTQLQFKHDNEKT